MAAEFIGVQMLVTLYGDPPTRLKGTVSAVEAGAGLTLSNVWMLNTNEWRPRITVSSKDIADLSEVHSAPSPSTLAVPQANVPQAVPHVPQPALQPAFVDPAIVAVGKQPGLTPSARAPETHRMPATAEKRNPEPAIVPSAQVASTSREVTPTVVVTAALQGLAVEGDGNPVESADDKDAAGAVLEYGEVTGQKKKRRQRKSGNARTSQEDFEASPAPATKTAGKGKGWRQTPILQSTASFQPFNSLKRNGAKGRQALDNGWASEDVTDVQEMGDFDFEGSLAKFDKRNLFEQMRKDDQIDEADRLVSHNRQPRPKAGTAGGKNLHYSENVLDMPTTILKQPKDRPASKETPNDFWNSEADDGVTHSGERVGGRDTGMGSRQGSRRGDNKAAGGRRSQSRKASEAARTGSGPSRVNSGVSHYRNQSLKGSRPSSRLSSRAATADSKRKQLPTPAAPQGLYLLPSNRRIETVSPLQMFNLENIAHNEIGLTEEMMTENAGRGIAEVALTALSDPAIKVRHAGSVDPATGNPPPQTVVVLAGNNKSGSRSVAAARHLRNKGINVLVCVVGLERGERDLLEEVRQQVRLYKNLGGRVFTKSDFFEHLRKISIPMLTIDTPRTSLSSLTNPAPVMLIIDALLGLAISFEELRNGDQATVYELVEWANRHEAFALAVDVPTGIDPTSGKVNVIDGNRLYVRPRYVVAIGAPKRGLLEAMIAADNDDADTILAGETAMPDDAVSEWKLYVADMGLGQAVWKKAGTKMRKGVDFDERWVLEMRYQGVANEEDEE
ncbi:enhancer of mRNA decapping [Madurella fahalii]|uniref:Enhancer of mRNA-decapping protein 3 n=1 Tax=Madurella fahalii TaxID=1157608 RepID=A0ABQ0GRH2_9PEZI